jgi:hypothetical protein
MRKKQMSYIRSSPVIGTRSGPQSTGRGRGAAALHAALQDAGGRSIGTRRAGGDAAGKLAARHELGRIRVVLRMKGSIGRDHTRRGPAAVARSRGVHRRVPIQRRRLVARSERHSVRCRNICIIFDVVHRAPSQPQPQSPFRRAVPRRCPPPDGRRGGEKERRYESAVGCSPAATMHFPLLYACARDDLAKTGRRRLSSIRRRPLPPAPPPPTWRNHTHAAGSKRTRAFFSGGPSARLGAAADIHGNGSLELWSLELSRKRQYAEF